MTEFLYRYRDILYTENKVKLQLSEYIITKRTQCGAWIDDCGKPKFVNLQATKQYACETIELAYKSFKMRKKRQIRILKANLRRALAASQLEHNEHVYIKMYEESKFDCE